MNTDYESPLEHSSSPNGCHEDCPAPQPWSITVCEATDAIWIERRTGGTKEAVCKMGPNFCEGRDLANAELILAALNSHDQLVEACEMAREVLRRENLLDYNGVDEFVDSDGVKGIGDVLDAALAASQPKP